MYIRRSTRTYKGRIYTNYVRVEALQTAKGPRQKTLCSRGDLSPRPRDDWLKLAHKLEHALAGQGELLHGGVLPRDPERDGLVEKIRGRRRPSARPAAALAPSPAAAAADAGTIAGDRRRVTTEQHRQAGPVPVGYQFWNRLGLDDILRDVGIGRRARQLACAMILNRLIQPAAEQAMPDWIRRTAPAEDPRHQLRGFGRGPALPRPRQAPPAPRHERGGTRRARTQPLQSRPHDLAL
jgi:hypothetical protein